MKKSIVWFKNDLRVSDNETLHQAILQSEMIIPVYCIDENQFKKTSFGFSKTGSFRAKFLLESIKNLDANLRKINGGLHVVIGNPSIEIPKLVMEYGASKVFAKKEVTFEEKATEIEVEKAIFKYNASLHTFSTSTLYHAEDLPFSIKDIPDVFTNFRKKIEKESIIRPTIKSPKSITTPGMPQHELPALTQLGLKEPVIDKRSCMHFKGGETEALKRLHYYLFESKAIHTYKETRNELLGADYSSKLSAWLALGCISPRQIHDAIKKYEVQFGANDSTYWLEFELLWRDYFRFMMKKHHSKYFLSGGIKADHNIASDHIDQTLLDKWVNGDTGQDFIDANMRELKYTGFMSNRGRQNVASYFCNELGLDWRYGAAYFEQQLIDYDASNNWGNWAYLAGVGNDPRGKRLFNIDKQAQEYDKNAAYRNHWLTSAN
jgi:deoxyribodipyrimidine photo-lyase